MIILENEGSGFSVSNKTHDRSNVLIILHIEVLICFRNIETLLPMNLRDKYDGPVKMASVG